MELSNREKNIIGDLILSLCVGIYYFNHVFTSQNGFDFYTAEMGKVVIHIIIFSIIAGSVLKILINPRGTEEEQDERDQQVTLRANSFSFYMLTGMVIILIGQLVFSQGVYEIISYPQLLGSPAIIAQILFLVLLLSSVIKSFAQLYYYRKG